MESNSGSVVWFVAHDLRSGALPLTSNQMGGLRGGPRRMPTSAGDEPGTIRREEAAHRHASWAAHLAHGNTIGLRKAMTQDLVNRFPTLFQPEKNRRQGLRTRTPGNTNKAEARQFRDQRRMGTPPHENLKANRD